MVSFDVYTPFVRHCSHCNHLVDEKDKYCSNCGQLCDVNGWEECGPDRCGNCHAFVSADDKYCRICGTKVGEGKFEPFLNLMQCIYGPMPVIRTHKCKKCGHSWENCLMIDNEKYCPICGKNKLEVRELNNDGFGFGKW